ncbi:hypothetical protein KFE25_002167 [Diacronema lutheri]|uniref:DJ-1/PfpI domain-containing protein n=1 Tax=Diacronema lutheri TaxID=2081491 RepID=A0A8J5XLN1_DIALT|nr:hypothetical protein KFE25_002167 [Diacronema lutheri]
MAAGVPARVLVVLTNTQHLPLDRHTHTGIWLGELTEVERVLEQAGHSLDFVSPAGGSVPVDPLSTGFLTLERSARDRLRDAAWMARLQGTRAVSKVDPAQYSAVLLVGGHGAMADFRHSEALHALVRAVYDAGKLVASLSHGLCGLLDARLSDGELLVSGKRLTGFSWNEELTVGRATICPYNLEAEAQKPMRRALYEKAMLPHAAHVVVDGTLITGQNTRSSALLGRTLARALADGRWRSAGASSSAAAGVADAV